MLAIKGIYDGKQVKLLEKPPKNKKFIVVVTFLSEYDNENEIREYTSQSDAFSFWEDPKEDIYQDYLKKK